MLATSQNNSPNILIRCHQEQAVLAVTRIESPIIIFSLILLLQSIITRFYNNRIIVIKLFIAQMITLQSSPFNIPIICTFKGNREQCKYILLTNTSVEFMLIIKVAEL